MRQHALDTRRIAPQQAAALGNPAPGYETTARRAAAVGATPRATLPARSHRPEVAAPGDALAELELRQRRLALARLQAG
jgi:hypothetical protein